MGRMLKGMRWGKTGLERNEMKASLRIRLFQHDTPYSKAASVACTLVAAYWLVLLAIGMPTGLGMGVDVTVILLVHAAASLIIPTLMALLLLPIGQAIPRFTAGSILYNYVVIYAIMRQSVGFDGLVALLLAALGIIFGGIAGMFVRFLLDRSVRLKLRLLGLAAASLVVLTTVKPPVLAAQLLFTDAADWVEEEQVYTPILTEEDGWLEHPGSDGKYGYIAFTYGSGTDKQRPEFAEGAALLSHTLDASAYIDDWNAWRTAFWGFDETKLPLNGRVWMPQGEGPFPLVLIVHGNHTMEKFSDDGYAYLGELLASRGMIAVSVDENYLNYSSWSGIPADDFKLRTWVLLQHIQEIGYFNEQAGNLFSGKVDMQNIAIIGHSRGGQAAAMAADAERWFDGDDTLPDSSKYRIQAVVALAPTDTNVDDKAARLTDVYYLTLHGTRDADVNTLKGDEQYSRVSFNDPKRFKASLVIENANHSYFNSSWGPNDLELPEGILLDYSGIMDRESQQSIAKLYVSAFLEIVFHDRTEYMAMFRDYREALQWLPEGRYFNRFESGAFKPLADFEKANSRNVAAFGSPIRFSGFTEWDIIDVLDKNGARKGTRGALLQWEDAAAMEIELSEQYRQDVLEEAESGAVLMFSIMNMEHELSDEVEPAENLEIVVELESEGGVSVMVPLEDYAPELTPVPEAIYTVLPLLEHRLRDGKFSNKHTPVFQTVEIPLDELEEIEEGFAPSDLERIIFHFDQGPSRVIFDDIGFVDDQYL